MRSAVSPATWTHSEGFAPIEFLTVSTQPPRVSEVRDETGQSLPIIDRWA